MGMLRYKQRIVQKMTTVLAVSPQAIRVTLLLLVSVLSSGLEKFLWCMGLYHEQCKGSRSDQVSFRTAHTIIWIVSFQKEAS